MNAEQPNEKEAIMAIADKEKPSQLGQSKSEKPMSREQRRYIERVQAEAFNANQRLSQKFLDFMIESDDVTDDELWEKAKQLSAQWKMYCKTKRLNDSVLNLVFNFCEEKIKEFKALRDEPVAEPATPNESTVLEAAEKDPLI